MVFDLIKSIRIERGDLNFLGFPRIVLLLTEIFKILLFYSPFKV